MGPGRADFVPDVGWFRALQRRGVDLTRIAADAQLPGTLFDRRQQTLEVARRGALIGALIDAVGTPDDPFAAVDALDAETPSPWLPIWYCSADLSAALRRCDEFRPLVGPVESRTVRADDHLRCELTLSSPDSDGAALQLLFDAALLLRAAGLACERTIVPLRIESPIGSTLARRVEGRFGAPVVRGAVTTIVLAARDADLAIPGEARYRCGLLRPLASQGDAASGETLRRFREMVIDTIAGGETTVAYAATRLSTSVRTLQRRLHEEGSAFQIALAQVRRELAEHYLAETTFGPTEVAFLLGYRDPNSFYRAFQNWTRTTPESYRRRRREMVSGT